MAIPENYARFTNARKVQSIKDNYASEMSEIARVRTINHDGRRLAEARAYTEAKQKLNDLKAEFQTKVSTERSRLERQLFGPGSTDPAQIVAHRDALERADRLKNGEEAQQAWERAKFSGDTGLQNAIMSNAIRKGWTDVVKTHTAEYPSAGTAVDQLRSLPEVKGAGVTALFHLSKPRWAAMGDDAYIARVAAESDLSV